MAEETAEDTYSPIIARCLAYLCLNAAADLREASLAEKVEFLERFGLNRLDCARVLKTTTDSIRVTMRTATKKTSIKNGRRRAEVVR